MQYFTIFRCWTSQVFNLSHFVLYLVSVLENAFVPNLRSQLNNFRWSYVKLTPLTQQKHLTYQKRWAIYPSIELLQKNYFISYKMQYRCRDWFFTALSSFIHPFFYLSFETPTHLPYIFWIPAYSTVHFVDSSSINIGFFGEVLKQFFSFIDAS